jgi:uncharacterized protein DUF5752
MSTGARDRVAGSPFQFYTASYLTRIENERAVNAVELRDGLERCSDASIFYHTFQSLGRHHFLTEGFSNDFAQWVLAALNQPGLAEQLGAIDVRSHLALSDLRLELWRFVDEFCQASPDESHWPAFEPFHFCASVEVTVPLPWEARTLGEFRKGLEQASHAAFQFHFLASRLRLRLQTNDFSRWLHDELGLEQLAWRANQIDFSTNTIDGAKARFIALIDRELAA